MAVKASLSLRDASPGSESSPSWSVFGSPPLLTVRHCTGQVATDPQSPEGGQRACPTRGAHPTASGRREGPSGVDEAVGPAWQLGCGLFGLPAREI